MSYRVPADVHASPHRDFAFAILALVQATLIFTIALIMIPLPQIASEFTLVPAELLLLQVSYGLPFSGLLLFGGRLADRYGGRRMLVIGLLIFGIAAAGTGLAPNFQTLVTLRFAQGLAGALTAPAALTVLRALYPDPMIFGRAMAAWGSVSVLGAVLGFILSGAITTWLSWRWMFSIPTAVALMGLISACTLFPSGYDASLKRRPGLDPLGAVLATLGIASTSYGLIVTNENQWTSSAVLVPLLAGLVLLAAFFVIQRRVRDPLLPPDFLLESRRITGLLGMLLAAAGSLLIEFILLLYLQQERGWSSLMTAGAFLPFAAILIASGQVTAPLVGRFGAARITVVGLIIAAVGLGLFVGLDRDTTYVSGLLPGLIVLAVGISLLFSGAAVLSMTNVPQHQAGLAGGVMNTAMELGPTVGFAALMSVAATQTNTVHGYALAFGTAAAVFIGAALLATALLCGDSRR